MHLESYLEFRARSRRTRPGDAASLKVFLELLQQKNLVIAPVEFDDKTPIDKTDIDPPGSAEAPIWKHRPG
jgi:hypothetical protein